MSAPLATTIASQRPSTEEAALAAGVCVAARINASDRRIVRARRGVSCLTGPSFLAAIRPILHPGPLLHAIRHVAIRGFQAVEAEFIVAFARGRHELMRKLIQPGLTERPLQRI